jgi:uncharacterized membrane protein
LKATWLFPTPPFSAPMMMIISRSFLMSTAIVLLLIEDTAMTSIVNDTLCDVQRNHPIP